MFDLENSRKIDYLRLSVTDRCNLRCTYCMPSSGVAQKQHDDILTFEEIMKLTDIFISLGTSKIRLTGGEPLVRKGVTGLVGALSRKVDNVLLTTNGILLSEYAQELKEAGLKRINISLDTLKEDKFRRITRIGSLQDVLKGVDEAIEAGLHPLKINMVVMKGVNEDEITDFVEFAFSKGIILRFIEFMEGTSLWSKDKLFPIEEVKRICNKRFKIKETGKVSPGPAEYYEGENGAELGFIKTKEYNCNNCSRLRLTSTGELKTCLYEERGVFLGELLRNNAHEDDIRDIIAEKMGIKDNVSYKNWKSRSVHMSSIGG